MMDSEATWSQQVFGTCDLGDSRRTRRLVDVGARLARQVGASMGRSVARASQRHCWAVTD